jgi:hypothetical protein
MEEYGPEIECSGEQDTDCIEDSSAVDDARSDLVRSRDHDSGYRAGNCARGILKITIGWPTLTRVHSAYIDVSSAERS